MLKLKNKYYRLQGRTELHTDLWSLYKSIGYIWEYTYFRNNKLYPSGMILTHQEHIEKALDNPELAHRCRIFRERPNVVANVVAFKNKWSKLLQYAQLNIEEPIIIEEVYLEPIVIKSTNIKALEQ